jgi:hypothetical protein
MASMSEKTIGNLRDVELANFSGLVGHKFGLQAGPSVVIDAELESATALPRGGPERPGLAKREPFSLMFCVAASARLPQRIYALDHPDLGRLEIFLVPVAMDARGLRLQAVFN